MDIDWTLAKAKTLWQYEELIAKLQHVLAYDFVREHYKHNMTDAAAYAKKLQNGYLLNGKRTKWLTEVSEQLLHFDLYRVSSYSDFVQQVSTREACESFLNRVGIQFEDLLQLLNYLFRWVLPFRCPVRELVDTITCPTVNILTALKAAKIGSNLDLLQSCGNEQGRINFARPVELEESLVLALIHRADISRLAYVRKKTISSLCGAGYDTLAKIANATVEEMEAAMIDYYRILGRKFSNSKAVMPLDWMIGGAKVLPKLLEN